MNQAEGQKSTENVISQLTPAPPEIEPTTPAVSTSSSMSSSWTAQQFANAVITSNNDRALLSIIFDGRKMHSEFPLSEKVQKIMWEVLVNRHEPVPEADGVTEGVVKKKKKKKRRSRAEIVGDLRCLWLHLESSTKRLFEQLLQPDPVKDVKDDLAMLEVLTELRESATPQADRRRAMEAMRQRMRADLGPHIAGRWRTEIVAHRSRIIARGREKFTKRVFDEYALARGCTKAGKLSALWEFVVSDTEPALTEDEINHLVSLRSGGGVEAHQYGMLLTLKSVAKKKALNFSKKDTVPQGLTALRDHVSPGSGSKFSKAVLIPLCNGLSFAMSVASRVLNVTLLEEVENFVRNSVGKPFSSKSLTTYEYRTLVKSLVTYNGKRVIELSDYAKGSWKVVLDKAIDGAFIASLSSRVLFDASR